MSTADEPESKLRLASFLPELLNYQFSASWRSAVAPEASSINIYADASREHESRGYTATGCFALDDRFAPEFERAMIEEKTRLNLLGREVKFSKRHSIGPERLASYFRRATTFPSALVLWVRCLDDDHGIRLKRNAAKAATKHPKNALRVVGLYTDSLIATATLLSNRQQSMAFWPDRNSFPEGSDDLMLRVLTYVGEALPTLSDRLPTHLVLPNAASLTRDSGNDSLVEIGRSIADLAAGIAAQHYSGGVPIDDLPSAAILAVLRNTATIDDPVSNPTSLVHVGFRIASAVGKPGLESLKRFFIHGSTGQVAQRE